MHASMLAKIGTYRKNVSMYNEVSCELYYHKTCSSSRPTDPNFQEIEQKNYFEIMGKN